MPTSRVPMAGENHSTYRKPSDQKKKVKFKHQDVLIFVSHLCIKLCKWLFVSLTMNTNSFMSLFKLTISD
jgi:hypothetical protein